MKLTNKVEEQSSLLKILQQNQVPQLLKQRLVKEHEVAMEKLREEMWLKQEDMESTTAKKIASYEKKLEQLEDSDISSGVAVNYEEVIREQRETSERESKLRMQRKEEELVQIRSDYEEEIERVRKESQKEMEVEKKKWEEIKISFQKELERVGTDYKSMLVSEKLGFDERMEDALAGFDSEKKEWQEEMAAVRRELEDKNKELARARADADRHARERGGDKGKESGTPHVSRHSDSMEASKESKSDVVPSPYAHRKLSSGGGGREDLLLLRSLQQNNPQSADGGGSGGGGGGEMMLKQQRETKGEAFVRKVREDCEKERSRLVMQECVDKGHTRVLETEEALAKIHHIYHHMYNAFTCMMPLERSKKETSEEQEIFVHSLCRALLGGDLPTSWLDGDPAVAYDLAKQYLVAAANFLGVEQVVGMNFVRGDQKLLGSPEHLDFITKVYTLPNQKDGSLLSETTDSDVKMMAVGMNAKKQLGLHFDDHIYKVLKQVHPDLEIDFGAMYALEDYNQHVLLSITEEAVRLASEKRCNPLMMYLDKELKGKLQAKDFVIVGEDVGEDGAKYLVSLAAPMEKDINPFGWEPKHVVAKHLGLQMAEWETKDPVGKKNALDEWLVKAHDNDASMARTGWQFFFYPGDIDTHDVQKAVCTCLPGELAKHAVGEGTKAVTKYLKKYATFRKSATSKLLATAGSGLQFNVEQIRNLMIPVCSLKYSRPSSGGINLSAVVYLSAVMEYMTAEVLELGGNAAKDNLSSCGVITPRHLQLAFQNDDELKTFYSGKTITSGSGYHTRKCMFKFTAPRSSDGESPLLTLDAFSEQMLACVREMVARGFHDIARKLLKNDMKLTQYKLLVDCAHLGLPATIISSLLCPEARNRQPFPLKIFIDSFVERGLVSSCEFEVAAVIAALMPDPEHLLNVTCLADHPFGSLFDGISAMSGNVTADLYMKGEDSQQEARVLLLEIVYQILDAISAVALTYIQSSDEKQKKDEKREKKKKKISKDDDSIDRGKDTSDTITIRVKDQSGESSQIPFFSSIFYFFIYYNLTLSYFFIYILPPHLLPHSAPLSYS